MNFFLWNFFAPFLLNISHYHAQASPIRKINIIFHKDGLQTHFSYAFVLVHAKPGVSSSFKKNKVLLDSFFHQLFKNISFNCRLRPLWELQPIESMRQDCSSFSDDICHRVNWRAYHWHGHRISLFSSK